MNNEGRNIYREYLLDEITTLEESNIIPKLTNAEKEHVLFLFDCDDKFLDMVAARIIEHAKQARDSANL